MKQEYHTKMFNFGQKYDFKQYDNIITIIMVDLLMAQNSNDWSCATSEFYNCYRKHILFTKSLWPQTAKGPFYLQVKLPLATVCLSQTVGFTLSCIILNVKQRSCQYQILKFFI